MTKRMLIDATHPEETRVVVVDQDQLVDFDFESSTKTQLKGNVYLAKVTRVEPSLQAAFVEYGGNRHGFLAFSEIHSDYYQIPQADREMLERLERDAIDESRAIENALDPADSEQPVIDAPTDGGDVDAGAAADTDAATDADQSKEGDETSDGSDQTDGDDAPQPAPESINEGGEQETDEVLGEQVRRRARLLRSYKIQEVIKRRQILLVQVVKEERGNKGAALTTYLSLAGRYCVLMPNTPRGGGISRKITNVNDRRRLKTITQDLDVPLGMGLIVRTAGQERNKSEIKRDYDYLLRQWSEIRETTLESVAPALIYQEGDLIKRSMRDLYSRDIDEILVEGDESYKAGKKLMQMMMPSHARRVKLYKDELPLFYRYHVEDQLDGMHSPTVDLPSGGSIVIHTTEALTAIDVNSGRSTRERHIDETAIKTNLEAADEVARQLRLRDLAGLVVIDFIDMAEHRHQRQVERRFRDALKLDRARLQVGRISMFGLLELSRQRLRASLLELSSQVCPVCSGLGVVRSTESCALHALRCVQEEGIKNEAKVLQLSVPAAVALYLLNQKRESLLLLEARYEMKVLITIDNDLLPSELQLDIAQRRELPESEGDEEVIEQRPARGRGRRERGRPASKRDEPRELPTDAENENAEPVNRRPAADEESSEEDQNRKRRRRRRRRRRDDDGETTSSTDTGRTDTGQTETVEQTSDEVAETTDASAEPSTTQQPTDEEEAPRKRRRRRRGRGDRDRSAKTADGDQETEVTIEEPVVEEKGPTPPAHGQAEELLAKLQKFVAITPKPPRKPAAAMDVEPTVVEVDAVEVEPEATVKLEPESELAVVDSVEELPQAARGDDEPSEPAVAGATVQEELAEALAPLEAVSAGNEPVEESVQSNDEAGDQPERRGWWSRWVK